MKTALGEAVFLLVLICFFLASYARPQPYIVYLGEYGAAKKTPQEIEEEHCSYVELAKNSSKEAKSSMIYSYKNVINGFTAFLTPKEATKISEQKGVISVFKDEPLQLHTSRSWDFISLLESGWVPKKADGLQGLLKKANYGTDVIVGVLDTSNKHRLISSSINDSTI